MKILFLTDNFPPEVNAPASRTFEHCRGWVNAGHDITVITCAPNFPKGKVYSGYKNKLWQRETMDGIRVIRVWSYITRNSGIKLRILDYMSYMLSAIVAAPFVRRADLVIGTSPQFFTACAAYVVSRLKRKPFVFELRDIWPESIKAVGAMNDSTVIRILERIELYLYRKADRIISVTNAFKSTLVDRGVDGGKINVVTNGVDLTRFHPQPKDPELTDSLGLEGKFVAGYIGTHGMAHALETLLRAAALLRDVPGGDRFRILLIGDGAQKAALEKQAREQRLDNLLFIDSVPKEEVVRYWSLLDVSIIHLRKTDLFKTVIPSKLFEGMSMGVPVLHGVAGESAEIVEHEGVGIVFEPENAEALCQGLTNLEKNPERYAELRARCLLAAQNYQRSILAGYMLRILEETAHYPQTPSQVEMISTQGDK